MENESDDGQMYVRTDRFSSKKCPGVPVWQGEGGGVKSYLGNAHIRSDKKELLAKKQAEVGDAGDQG